MIYCYRVFHKSRAAAVLCRELTVMLALHFITNSAEAIPGISVTVMQCEMYSKQGKAKKEFTICICYEQQIKI